MYSKCCVFVFFQILLSSASRVDHYRDLEVDPGFKILADTVVDPSGQYVYTLSTNKVLVFV